VSPLVVLLAVLAFSCFAVAGLYFYIASAPTVTTDTGRSASGPVSAELELVDVLVPVAPIEAGTALERTMFRKESRPSLVVGPNHVRDFEQLQGAFSASFIAAGQPLLTDYVTLKRPINQIQANIPDGYRAVTIAVDETTSVEGWARPGAKVDVVLASSVGGKAAVTVIVQNARVLSAAGRVAADQRQAEESKGPSVVTIMVTMDEAQRIQLATASGSVSLALRGDEDTVESPVNTTITLDSILGTEGGEKPTLLPSEGRVKIDGREYVIIAGRLVPEGQAAAAMAGK
jgi:pilus assembly protein CpaB